MSFDDNWHVPFDRLEAYATGRAYPLERSSIEAHLLACAHCRKSLAVVGPSATREVTLAAIIDRIDRPRRPLHRSTGVLLVSLASPALVGATALLAAALLAVVGVTAVLRPPWSAAVLVALAPLAPIVAAVVAFWPATDPAGSLAPATPLAGGRLPFLRALFATSASAAAGLISSAFTPLAWSDSIIWLAPGMAFAAVVVAAATWIDPARLAVGLATGWIVVCLLWARAARSVTTLGSVDDLAIHDAAVQVMGVVVIVVASTVILWRRDAQPNWRTS